MADLISLGNSILELTSGVNNAKLARQVSELTLAIARTEKEKAQSIEENTRLKEENKSLREDRENPLVFSEKDRLYYHPSDEKHISPFCQYCYELRHLRIHLTRLSACPHCKTEYPPSNPVIPF
jgi:hypothetical protein